jgi:hypothetical protein
MSESKATRLFMDELCIEFPLVGTDDNPEREVYRALVFADFAARVVLPLALAQTGYLVLAKRARSLAYIDNRVKADNGARVAQAVLVATDLANGSTREQIALRNLARRVLDTCGQAALALGDLFAERANLRDGNLSGAILRRANMRKAAEQTAIYAAGAVLAALGTGIAEDELIMLATEAVADAMVVPDAQ